MDGRPIRKKKNRFQTKMGRGLKQGKQIFEMNITAGAIIRDGDRNEVPFSIARATPCEVRLLTREQIQL